MLKFWLALLIILSVSTAFAAEQDMDHIGFFGLYTVVYNISRIGPHLYLLEAHTSNGAPVDELERVYRARAARICGGKPKSLTLKLGEETYMGTFNATLRIPMTAPKLAGKVSCK